MLTRMRLAVLCVWFSTVVGQLDDLSRYTDQEFTEDDLRSLTFDEIIRNLLPQEDTIDDLVQTATNQTLIEFDIIATKEQVEQFYGNSKNKRKSRQKRKAIKNTIYRWPNGRLPYTFLNKRHFSYYDQFMMKVAMREWEKYTCVRFEEKRPEDENYILFRDGQGCSSQLGMVGGAQNLILDRKGCRFKGLYLHELGHALGLIHEHQLPVRDDWIEIIEKNVDPNMLKWFQKYDEEKLETFNMDYEYSSVMHYGLTAFSKKENGTKLQTIRPRMPGKEYAVGRVYRKELSFTDIKTVNLMYNCSKSCEQNPNTPKCTSEGFLDQNCRCICKDGSSDCTVGKLVDKSCTNSHGEDWLCFIWAKQNECLKNPRFMKNYCKKACGVCGDAFDDYKEGVCEDVYDQETCEKWRDNSDCLVNEQWMKQNCKYTCSYCDLDKPPPRTDCNNTYENETKCERWAKRGECAINPRWMPQNCQKACRTCPEKNSDDKSGYKNIRKAETGNTTNATIHVSSATAKPKAGLSGQAAPGAEESRARPQINILDYVNQCNRLSGSFKLPALLTLLFVVLKQIIY